ncbi:hypothetical protein C8J56DRAFT_897806 [Mycena floridula]|nr:hypothetical protein C8J56DRAFT_897806 [Mycena floridula]
MDLSTLACLDKGFLLPNVLATNLGLPPESRPCLRQVKAKVLVKPRLRLPLSADQAVEEAYSGDRVKPARMSNQLYPDFDHHSLEEIIGAEEIRGFISKTKEKTDGDDGGIRRRSRLWLSTRFPSWGYSKFVEGVCKGDLGQIEAKHEGPVPVLSEVGDIKSMDARRHGLTPSKAVLMVHRGGFGKWPPRSISRLVLESGILMCPAVVPIFPISVVLVLFSSERVQDHNQIMTIRYEMSFRSLRHRKPPVDGWVTAGLVDGLLDDTFSRKTPSSVHLPTMSSHWPSKLLITYIKDKKYNIGSEIGYLGEIDGYGHIGMMQARVHSIDFHTLLKHSRLFWDFDQWGLYFADFQMMEDTAL